MPKLLHQDIIIAGLKSHGIVVTREQLQAFLDSRPSIGEVVIRPRGRDIDKDVDGCRPHTARWYDVITPHLTAEEADDYIIAHIVKHGLPASESK